MGAGQAGGRARQGTGCVSGSGRGGDGGAGGLGRGELPEGWAWATVGEIAEVRLGRQRSPKHAEGDHMRPYVRAANVDWGGLRLADVKKMNFTDDEFETYRLRPGDILLNEASGSPSEVGKPVLWNGEIEGCCFQNTLIRVRLDEGDPRYLAHLLWYEAARGQFARATRGVGICHLGAAKLAGWHVPVPPVAEQRRIADAVNAGVARLDVLEQKLRAALKGVSEAWNAVLDAVAAGTMPGVDVAAPENHLVELVAEVSGGIQKQARRRPVDNAYPFLRVANVARGTLDLADVHKVELFKNEIERYRLADGDLLVVEGNGSSDQIGRAAVWHGEIDDCVHQNHLIRVRPGPELVPAYLELVWNSPTVARRLQRAASSTSGLHTLSTRKLKALTIPVFALQDQERLVAAAEVARARLNRAKTSARTALAHVVAIRRALLAEAFSGRLAPQNPDDEPAEVLLKRIRVEREVAEAARKAARRATRTKAGQASTPAPPPHRDTPALDGEQTTLPLEFSS
ncbi:restriction endonuclease subunit S [Streptomyces sp. NPDC004166]